MQMTRVEDGLPEIFTPCIVVTRDPFFPALLATYDGERWVGGMFLANIPGVIAWAYVQDAKALLMEHVTTNEYRPGGP